MSLQIKFISEDSKVVTYGYELETDKLYFHFNKKLKTVDIIYMRFIFQNYNENWTTQEENIKYSCKYGHWQLETPHISQKDVEFMCQILQEMKGGEE